MNNASPPRGSAAVEAYPARQRIEVAVSARHARQPTSPWLVANGIHLQVVVEYPMVALPVLRAVGVGSATRVDVQSVEKAGSGVPSWFL